MRPLRRTTNAMTVTRARPETRAELTNSGGMMAEYQNPREICKPKIQAVMECTSTAAGSAIQARA